MKVTLFFVALVLSQLAVAECLPMNYSAGRIDVCKGARVYLLNDSGEPRIGNVISLYRSGKAKIQYTFNGGSNEIFREASEVYPSIECIEEFCAQNEVQLRNDSNQIRQGRILEAFANGLLRVSYTFSGGENEVFRSPGELQKAQFAIGKFQIGDSVFLLNENGQPRSGEISLLTNRNAKIRYIYNGGVNELYRDFSEISKEAECVRGVCRGAEVLIKNDSNQNREGIAKRVFENGRVFIEYMYNGVKNEIWRKTNECSPLDEEI